MSSIQEYGVVPFNESSVYWVESLERGLDFVKMHTERSQLRFVVKSRPLGSNEDGEIYMTYPHTPESHSTQEKMNEQIENIRKLCESSGWTRKRFFTKLTDIREFYQIPAAIAERTRLRMNEIARVKYSK